MKILKIFGIVVGIHVFALILIFANPGCSSTTKPPPEPADTVAKADAAPMITIPALAPAAPPSDPSNTAPLPTGFNPDAPASYDSSSPGIRFTPTRPNTPAASVVQQQPVTDVTPAATYSVKSGDSLWTIAKRTHISASELAKANNLTTTAVIHQGQKLIIPSKAASPAPSKSGSASTASTASSNASVGSSALSEAKSSEAGSKSSSSNELPHTVKTNETIGMIARKYGVRARDIEVRNNITDPAKLRAGAVLIIPGWKSTAGKGSKGASSDTTAKASSSTAPAEPKPETPVNILEQEQAQPSAPSSSVPVIRIDDSTAPAAKP